jgi:hypothetical protein
MARGNFVASRAKSQSELLLERSGGKYKAMSSHPFEDDLKIFRSFGEGSQQLFIARLKHRKAILEKDWFVPGITLVVVAATALVLSSTTMVPYAMQWRAETQKLIDQAEVLGIDRLDVNPDALVEFYTQMLLLTAFFIAIFAGLLVLWNFNRAWRLATTSAWIEALEAEIAPSRPIKTERTLKASRSVVPARWSARAQPEKRETKP